MNNPNFTITNNQFAKKDVNFNLWCILNSKAPTKRQASKYRNNPLNDFSNDFTLISHDCESSDWKSRSNNTEIFTNTPLKQLEPAYV